MIFKNYAHRFFMRGYKSRRDNLSLYPVNPYNIHSRAYEEWLAGWHHADAEMINELRNAAMVIVANYDGYTHDAIGNVHPVIT